MANHCGMGINAINSRVSRGVGGLFNKPKKCFTPSKIQNLKSGRKCVPGYCGTDLLWPNYDWRSFGVCGAITVIFFLFLTSYFLEGKNLTFLCFDLEQIRGHFSIQVPPWRLGKVVSDLLYLKA